MKRSVK